MRVLNVLSIGFLVALVALSGCGPKKLPGLVTVKGAVTYEGVPLPYASMTFAPDPEKGAQPGVRVSTAMTDAKGEFVATTLGRKGVMPGSYVVTVEKYIPNEEGAVEAWEKARSQAGYVEPVPAGAVGEDAVDENGVPVETAPATFNVVSAIPLTYSEKETSDLRAIVPDKGATDLRFELKKEM